MTSGQRAIVLSSQVGLPQKEMVKPECSPIFWSRVNSVAFFVVAGMSTVYKGPAKAVAEKRTVRKMLLSESCMFAVDLLWNV